jgi:glycosyltransferase involved in cell wall biosynthesis
MDLISIIIPTWRKTDLIWGSVESCLEQTGGVNVDIVLACNGRCVDWFMELSDKYRGESKVRIFHTDTLGVSAGRNLGLVHARGNWVMFLSDDDYFSDGYIKSLLNTAAQFEADVPDVICGSIVNEYCFSKFYNTNNYPNIPWHDNRGKVFDVESLSNNLVLTSNDLLPKTCGESDRFYRLLSGAELSQTYFVDTKEFGTIPSLFGGTSGKMIKKSVFPSQSAFDEALCSMEDTWFWTKEMAHRNIKVACSSVTDEYLIVRKDTGTAGSMHIHKVVRSSHNLCDSDLEKLAKIYRANVLFLQRAFEIYDVDSNDIFEYSMMLAISVCRDRIAFMNIYRPFMSTEMVGMLASEFRGSSCSPWVLRYAFLLYLPAASSNNEQPLVSIVVPNYNSGSFIEECFDTLVHQTYQNIEIIVVDDGSTDDSISIIKQYSEVDHRITIIKQLHKGVNVARNTGLNAASGEWIYFVGSDEMLEACAIESLVARAIESNAEIVSLTYQTSDLGYALEKIGTATCSEWEKDKPTISLDTTKLFSRQFLLDNYLQFTPNITYGADIEFMFRCLWYNPKYCFLALPLCRHHDFQENNTIISIVDNPHEAYKSITLMYDFMVKNQVDLWQQICFFENCFSMIDGLYSLCRTKEQFNNAKQVAMEEILPLLNSDEQLFLSLPVYIRNKYFDVFKKEFILQKPVI